MALVLTAIVVSGFSNTVPGDLAPPGLPMLLKVHALVFAAWMLPALVQPALAMTGSLAWHRRLGWAGLALVYGLAPSPVAAAMLEMVGAR